MDTSIKGSTKLIALLGHPVAHSLSPQIHNHALRTLGLPFAYVPLDVPPERFHSVIQTMRGCSFTGANVTIPHKSQVVNYCDGISDLSEKTGTVNTLYFKDGLLWGTTTDYDGFMRALKWMGHDPQNGTIVILGNGGTARTLASALALYKIPRQLTLAGRNLEKIQQLASTVSKTTGFPVAAYATSDPNFGTELRKCSLLVNCTSAGMHPRVQDSPIDPRLLHRDTTVFDAIYNPESTVLLDSARKAGCAVQNGLRMLLYQALASFTYWTGVDVPEDIFDLEELRKLI